MVESLFKSFWRKINHQCTLLRKKLFRSKGRLSNTPSHELELPEDIWILILGNLRTGDRARCRLVCNTWNRLLKSGYIAPAPEAPWQIWLGYDISGDMVSKISFRSKTESRTYRFDVPTFYGQGDGSRCFGSSRGWLLMVVRLELMALWNPITGAVYELPPMPMPVGSSIERLEVFSIGSTECVVAMVYDYKIMVCTPQDANWTTFCDDKYSRSPNVTYIDLLFHPENAVLYVLALETTRQCEDYLPREIEIPLQSCCVHVHPFVVTMFCTPERPKLHMVKSLITQEVLVLIEISDQSGMAKFKVARLPGRGGVLEVVTSIGQQAIFFGGCLLSCPIVEGLLPDSIYFTIEQVDWLNFKSVNNNFVFSIQENSTQLHSCTSVEDSMQYRVGWFTPQLTNDLSTFRPY